MPYAQEKQNGVLRCYNQFPRQYQNFQEMINQLPDIAHMGFNAVWAGPLHPVTEVTKSNGDKGSLYAMVDAWKWRDDFFKTSEVEQQRELLRTYTHEAQAHGITPMFDLVLKHMGKNSALELGQDPYFKQANIDTTRWFKSGVFKVDKQTWDDVQQFNYDDPHARHEIIEHLWKPFIKQYVDLGFTGVRIDAAQHVPHDVVKELLGYARQLWKEKGIERPVVMGEVLGSSPEQRHNLKWHELDDCGISHITNYAYWLPNSQDPHPSEVDNQKGPPPREMSPAQFREYWDKKIGGFLHEKGEASHVVRLTSDGKERTKTAGGTVGMAYSHDDIPIAAAMIDNGITDSTQIEKATREKIALSAFCSDAGWIGGTGLEMADSRKPSVFDTEENRRPPQQHANLRPFITEINTVLAKQPALEFINWSDRYILENRPELVIINTHNGPPDAILLPGEQHTYLRIVNTDPSKTVTLSSQEMKTLADWSDKNVGDFQPSLRESKGIALCGGVEIAKPPLARETAQSLSAAAR